MAALRDVSRRWHVPPAFSVEFVGYYLDRNSRVTSLRKSLERLTKENEKLLAEDDKLRNDYDEVLEIPFFIKSNVELPFRNFPPLPFRNKTTVLIYIFLQKFQIKNLTNALFKLRIF